MRSRVKLDVTLFALICVLLAFVGVAYSADERETAATDAAQSNPDSKIEYFRMLSSLLASVFL